MTTESDEIVIKGITYVPKGQESVSAKSCAGLPLVLIRTYSAGVHFGYLEKRESTLAGIEIKLLSARRVYYWSGAASLSQMAMEGVTKPNDCKISMPVSSIDLIAIEIIPITEKAEKILGGVKEWKM
jgi:hypothetical protein